jgi:DNA-binding winged helix-turn-helix (wHTH) protein
MSEPAISFGVFRFVAARRLLLEGDKPVRLGGRAFDILAALVERAGEVVTKEALIARVWPQTFVEEANLKIQVSALRRALGDGQGGHHYIVTVPGRGYNFVAPVRLEEPSPPIHPMEIVPAKGNNNLPLAVTRVIGRDEIVATVVARLSRQRLVTIAGPGGIGKTTVALAVAEHMIADYEHGVWLIDLAAADCFDQATVMAREQGDLSWELRIGFSLCRLRMTQGWGDEGRRELASLYDRFTEGFDTADLVAAKQLLDAQDNAGRD